VVTTAYAHELIFSIRRARKRRRRRRVAAALAVASVVTIALRVPGSDASLRLVEDFMKDQAAASKGPESSETTASMLRFRRSVFTSRPDQGASEVPSAEAVGTETSTETSAETSAAPTSITDIVYSAAAEFGISGDYLLSVASCESALDPFAYNAAGYHGLFQFDQQTWAAYGYGWIYNAVAQARTAGRLLAAGHYSRWPNCA
jgi:soluble lytic murein transglycosylase-like protein